MTRLAAALMAALIAPAFAGETALSEPNVGYYCGAQTFYPYDPVYMDNDDCLHGQAYSIGGPLPKSAALPALNKWCEWVDTAATMNTGDPTGGWYQWKPRDVPSDKQKWYGAHVCYFEDRGKPMNINDLKRDQ